MASVTINEGMPKPVTIVPENNPAAAQTAIPPNEHSTRAVVPADSAPPKRWTNSAAQPNPSAIRLPTDRSIPAVMITIVMPIAMMAITAIRLATLIKFSDVKKFGHL